MNESTTEDVSSDPKNESVACDDRWADEYKNHAREAWFEPLCAEKWHLPFPVVFDLGIMLMKPSVHLAGCDNVPDDYVRLLDKIRADEHFRTCSSIIGSVGRSDLKDAAIRTAIKAMTRHTRRQAPAPEPEWKSWHEEVAKDLGENLKDSQADSWIQTIDLIAVKASSRLDNGAKLIDYDLLDQCLDKWDSVPDHLLRTLKTPTPRMGIRDVSRRQGDILGYTGVRPRLPTDALTEILPPEWTLLKADRRIGLDKLLNRNTLVYSKESPEDLIPELQVFVAFILDFDPSLGSHRSTPHAGACMAKALAHRMILDAARQVPFDRMGMHAAVYVKDFDRTVSGPASRSGSVQTYKACFDLRTFAGATAGSDSQGSILTFDELVPFYFSYSFLKAMDVPKVEGPWPELCDDPFTTLSEAVTATGTYSSVLLVACSSAERWPTVFPGGSVPLRPVDVGRDTVLLVDMFAPVGERQFKWGVFQSLREAEVGHSAQMTSGSDADVRDAFLDMLLGPVQTKVDSRTPIIVD